MGSCLTCTCFWTLKGATKASLLIPCQRFAWSWSDNTSIKYWGGAKWGKEICLGKKERKCPPSAKILTILCWNRQTWSNFSHSKLFGGKRGWGRENTWETYLVAPPLLSWQGDCREFQSEFNLHIYVAQAALKGTNIKIDPFHTFLCTFRLHHLNTFLVKVQWLLFQYPHDFYCITLNLSAM